MPKIIQDEPVFQAAFQAVVEGGYAGATTKQIAEAAGISEVTLFRKYGSKAELIKQAIAAMANQLGFESVARYTGSVEADLLHVVQTYQASAEKNGQFIYSILLEIQREPHLAEVVATPLHIFESIGKLLAQYQDEGVLKKEAPLHALAGLLGPLIATNLMRTVTTEASSPPLDLTTHVAAFLDGRRRQNGTR